MTIEERINELGEKYEKQKEINKDLVYYNNRLLTQADAATKRAVALVKENAELKKKIGIYQKGMYDEIEKRDKKLTKAKEIIMNLRNIITSDITIIDTEEKGLFFKQAVEFLKEEA